MDRCVIKWDSSLHGGEDRYFQCCVAGSYCWPFNVTVSETVRVWSKTTTAALPPPSITVTSALVAWGTKFHSDPRCQRHCPDKFHPITLSLSSDAESSNRSWWRWGCLKLLFTRWYEMAVKGTKRRGFPAALTAETTVGSFQVNFYDINKIQWFE